MARATPVLYLDIDGTVREGRSDALGRFVNGPADVRVFPLAVRQMRRWRANGGRIVGVSNQGGVALGIVSSDLVASAMKETQRQTGGLFDAIVVCEHHPNAPRPDLAECGCRKPKIGMVVHATRVLSDKGYDEYYPPRLGLLVGDRPEDRQCAHRAGIAFQWAALWRSQAEDGI